ncbi:hypothetical protein TrVE_jg12468 [Triparma verrucosa]|uniref:Uncharacterized protein n=1 Tax=Triparma verrucosa TaxID=1606542 RepID=A0A9W7BF42_9STRA|nr:hypothetical protein TrVE_jg12468 [Triparma verrucosa]
MTLRLDQTGSTVLTFPSPPLPPLTLSLNTLIYSFKTLQTSSTPQPPFNYTSFPMKCYCDPGEFKDWREAFIDVVVEEGGFKVEGKVGLKRFVESVKNVKKSMG